MSAQLDDFCAWARPCNGTYLNEQAFNAQAVWQAAQAAMPVDPDAARYRWFRRNGGTAGYPVDQWDRMFDASIDAEIARTGGAA